MKKTLESLVNKTKKAMAIGLFVGAATVPGCAALGALLMTSPYPVDRAIGAAMFTRGQHQNRMEEARAGRTEVNVYVNGQNAGSNNSPVVKLKRGIYVGDIENGKANGWGRFTSTSKRGNVLFFYNGQWKDGYRHGKGHCSSYMGRQSGMWERGEFLGNEK